MKRSHLTIIVFVSLSSILQAQVKIDSMFVYDHFLDRGFTTAGASTEFGELKQNNTRLIEVNFQDIDSIASIMAKTKCKKHTQTKLGIEMLFCSASIENQDVNLLVGTNLIVDFSNYKNYWIKDERDQDWIANFIQRVKEEAPKEE